MEAPGMNRLPDDVLHRFIKLLKDMRPTIDPTVEHTRQRPNMLLTLMRVCPRFHNLIISYIYTPSITITDPSKFFFGLNRPSPNGCVPKKYRLKMIKKITFAYPHTTGRDG
ncbi:hypothetical protein I302_105359 [Kwoniella bestiolae CBS 10118]|uniref:Uncharacterized protein n=1 Tax=Kwoniella bestiolae CBS 10118 TaxID=1296100 RepID=A0AAJ8MA38_9TREE